MTIALTENPTCHRLVSRGLSGDVWEQIRPIRITRGKVAFFSRTRREWIVKGGAYVRVEERGIVLFGRCFSTSTEHLVLT